MSQLDSSIFRVFDDFLSGRPKAQELIRAIRNVFPKAMDSEGSGREDIAESVKRDYWQVRILWEAVSEIAIREEAGYSSYEVEPLFLTDVKFTSLLKQRLSHAAVSHEIISGNGDAFEHSGLQNLVKLGLESYDPKSSQVENNAEFSAWVSRRIARYLDDLCRDSARLLNLALSRGKETLVDSCAMWPQLWQTVSSMITQMNCDKIELTEVCAKNKAAKQALLQDALIAAKRLNRLIAVEGPEPKLRLINAFTSWARLLLSVTDLKLQMNEKELERAIYSGNMLALLKQLSTHLKTQKAQLKSQREELEKSLEAYAAAGPDFERLLNVYNGLSQTLENRKWALRECLKE